MRTFMATIILASCLAFSSSVLLSNAAAVDLIRLTEQNYDQLVPKGKEVDAIYGDWVLRNKYVVAVIANPTPGRKANMTVRGVGGMIIDYSTRYSSSDQLSCFYPAAGRFLFENKDKFWLRIGDDNRTALGETESLSTQSINLEIEGRAVSGDGTLATVVYSLSEDQPWLEYTVEIRNAGKDSRRIAIEDSMRCDGNLFTKGTLAEGRLFYAEDRYFGQCYGVQHSDGTLTAGTSRNIVLRSSATPDSAVVAGESVRWNGFLFCAHGVPGIRAKARLATSEVELQEVILNLKNALGPLAHARLELSRAGEVLGSVQTTEEGQWRTRLPAGDYEVLIRAEGYEPRQHSFAVKDSTVVENLSFKAASRVRITITDGEGRAIPAKVQFTGIDGTDSPDFGPDSAIAAIKNVVYCANGKIDQRIDPGTYQVIISRGPEYDADIQQITVTAGKLFNMSSRLPRVVDSAGWISTEYHSHSSPSGDNVSHQTGRVLNLLAEHIEFAPCTEHNRIDTYSDDLELLKATQFMATCTGMELTGSPLPVNHQNAFPMQMHEHTQDGGGPDTHADPVKQIERLALWDNSSPKVVQSNHPNIPQILGDKDLDGKPDGGFRGMLGWMDVIEIHPPEAIFQELTGNVAQDVRNKKTFYWMQLLNLGYRIPGVVNTDAHYNFHGSGWLRNYISSSSDDPTQLDLNEMMHSTEHGHLVMTTGPFLEAQIASTQADRVAIAGDDLVIGNSRAVLSVRVQCPNWFDINRVQVFANGRPIESLNFTRKSHPESFSADTVRFEAKIKLPRFEQDTYIIVATIGEGLQLGPVMGPTQGKLPPVALTNPIFLDVDGGGFQANGDDLGVPFMLPPLDETKEE